MADSKSKIRILIANPNATSSMTDNCLKLVTPTLPPDVSVHGFTSPHPGPTAIEGAVDNVLSSAAAFRALLPLQENEHYDAILVACYSSHALIPMLREELDVPIIGIMEASLFYARTLGARIGVVSTSSRSAIAHRDSFAGYGFSSCLAGLRSCDLGVLDLERLPRQQVLDRMKIVAKELVELDGADVLTLGCAGMTDMQAAVQEAVGGEVQVVDGVVAGGQHLIGVVRMGGETAKRGLWRSSRAGREARGQGGLDTFVRTTGLRVCLCKHREGEVRTSQCAASGGFQGNFERLLIAAI
ncbi:hypothetical protein LTR95_008735 [Oleoguttula sp. CCFEE 5521]